MSKIDPNQPAFPCAGATLQPGSYTVSYPYGYPCGGYGTKSVSIMSPGLTKREYFAGLAMASIVGCFRNNMRGHDDAERESDSDIISFDRSMAIDGGDGAEEIATDAVILADALIAALNAQPGGEGA